jgi:hypothetical protein
MSFDDVSVALVSVVGAASFPSFLGTSLLSEDAAFRFFATELIIDSISGFESIPSSAAEKPSEELASAGVLS